jgi:hypothetical protein
MDQRRERMRNGSRVRRDENKSGQSSLVHKWDVLVSFDQRDGEDNGAEIGSLWPKRCGVISVVEKEVFWAQQLNRCRRAGAGRERQIMKIGDGLRATCATMPGFAARGRYPASEDTAP